MPDRPLPTDALRYPTGRFAAPDGPLSPAALAGVVGEIAALPAALRAATEHLADDALDTPYRPGGWTIRQVVHHVPDSHVNAYVRFKWALTEDAPAIKAYDETAWAELADSAAPVAGSLDLLAALHARWAGLMRTLTAEDWARTFVHPVSGATRLDRAAAMYAWHGRHHLAHVALAADGA